MKIKDLLETVQDVELTPEQEKQIKEYLGIKEPKKWKPNHGEMYWYIPHCGDIASTIWSNYCDLDADLFAMGNCFKTKEEAEFALEKYKVYLELKNFADENNDPIDWNNKKQEKYIINYCTVDKKSVFVDSWATYQFIGCVYFSSYKLAKRAIQKVGEDRIKKYLFGVE
jgi:hypothetical protein